MRHAVKIFGLLMVALLIIGASDCNGNREERKHAVSSRWQSFDEASKRHPEPNTTHYPLREALVKMTERQDRINHPWYVYILGMNGNVVAYYVGQTVPINACNFLSSTEDVYSSSNGNLALTAPSLDGIFYGGAGASSGCDAWFFFDYATDALIQIRGVNYYVSDVPLLIKAEPILVETEE